MKRFLLSMLLPVFVLAGAARTWRIEDLPNVQVQDHTKHLVNPDGIVPPDVAARIDTLLLDARRQSSAEIVAVIVDDIGTDDIDTYATELFNTWRIGKKDKNNGMLLLVSKDGRAATLRTGYGSEGVMPDIIAGRIVNDDMIPHFREGDYAGGMLAGVEKIHRIVTDPDARAELQSKYADQRAGNIDGDSFFQGYLTLGCVVAVIMLVLLLVGLWRCRGRNDYEKYTYMSRYIIPFAVASVFFLFIPAVVWLALWLLRRYWRNHPRHCSNCGAMMKKLDEDTDNRYLTMAQDMEERLNSVDYDVWLCPNCGETEINSFVNSAANYRECPTCHARTMQLTGTRDITPPTEHHEGLGEKIYTCLNCHNSHVERYKIAKKEPPVVFIGGGGGGGGFGGGGSFGGGFGGGFSGGGGATGRW